MKAEYSMTRSRAGFTLADLLIVVGVVAILGSIILPRLRGQGCRARRDQCVNNLKSLGLAARIYAADHDERFPSWFLTNQNGTRDIFSPSKWIVLHFQSLTNTIQDPRRLSCYVDSRKPPTQGQPLTSHNISYFVAPDVQSDASEDILFGDRHVMVNGRAVSGLLLANRTNTIAWTRAGHQNMGNVAQADGCVQQYNSRALTNSIVRGSKERIRWVIP